LEFSYLLCITSSKFKRLTSHSGHHCNTDIKQTPSCDGHRPEVNMAVLIRTEFPQLFTGGHLLQADSYSHSISLYLIRIDMVFCYVDFGLQVCAKADIKKMCSFWYREAQCASRIYCFLGYSGG